MLRLKIFGRFRAEDDLGKEIAIKSKKARALLAYLALPAGKARSREELMALLWSDRGDDRARGSLRQALSGLRRDLGGDLAAALRISNDAVSLDPKRVIVDGHAPGDQLLDGLHIRDPAFDEWLRDERLRCDGEEAVDGSASISSNHRKVISLAVLPLVNLSDDPDQEYFADGLTEDLIAAMGRFHSLAVIARNSAFHYKGRFPLARQVGEELDVDYLVEGSVRTSGNRIRVSAQLTETTEGKQLWAERYDRELEDIFAVQDDVVASIAAELGVNLTVVAEARTRSLPPENLTAYDRLLKGRAAWWRGNVNEGFRLVEEAAAIDPAYAAALAWLALQYAYQVFSASMGLTPEDLGPRSRALAKRALELDGRDPFVHMAASASFGFTPGGDKDRGLRHIEIATAMNPHDSEIMLLRAWHLAFHGRFDESLEVIQQVHKLNPFGTQVVSECLADLYYKICDYEKCLAIYEDRSEAPPQVLVVLAACYGQLGAMPEAQSCLKEAAESASGTFAPNRFAETQIAICARQREADLWRDGFRKVGLDV
ncbi:MAG: winged helix-turn-helix domain-containing protein [Kiloniellales bacterium]|nr:winged helix-turn-helix domain-containing protein [Kiloniellales bacterium]